MANYLRSMSGTAIPTPAARRHVAVGRQLRMAEGGSRMPRPTVRSPFGLSRRAALGRTGAVAAALGLGGRVGRTAAQDATPPAAPGDVLVGLLGAGQPTSTPGMELILRRSLFAPGEGIPPHTHPGSIVIVVDAGTWGYTPLGGSVQLTRAAVDGTPTPAEEAPTGVETILTAGDALFVEDSHDEIRNLGEDDVVLLIAGLTPVGEPFQTMLSDTDTEGTPAP